MIACCEYTRGKMSVNGALPMIGHVSLVIDNWLGRGYT